MIMIVLQAVTPLPPSHSQTPSSGNYTTMYYIVGEGFGVLCWSVNHSVNYRCRAEVLRQNGLLFRGPVRF